MRRNLVVALSAALLTVGCGATVIGSGPGPDVVVVDGEDERRGPRALRGVPAGHYPPPGECRIWYAGRPAGQQPPPTRCGELLGRISPGAFILYGEDAWDTGYDWSGHERRRSGSVPEVILELMESVDRR